MEDFIRLATPILTAAVSGLVLWVWALWQSHNTHKQAVGEHYIKRAEVHRITSEFAQGVKEDIHELRKEMKFLRYMTLKIGERLHVPAIADLDD